MKTEQLKTFSPDQRLELIITAIDRLTILAYTKLEREMVIELPEKTNAQASPEPDNLRLKWIYSKVGLYELIYSLKELGVFGEADLKSITRCFAYMFSIDLGNITSAFQEILERKKGYTNITDKLREVFLKKIDRSLK